MKIKYLRFEVAIMLDLALRGLTYRTAGMRRFRLVVTNRELCKQARCYPDHAGSSRPVADLARCVDSSKSDRLFRLLFARGQRRGFGVRNNNLLD